MTDSLRNCLAPAKLNLFLHVIGRREDGYHLLQSVFQLVNLCDTLHFKLREDTQICRSNALEGVPEASDLTVRAATLLQEAAIQRLGKTPQGVDITIEKILPMGGGLGGGSSNAATTLMALNHLWKTGFTQHELIGMGSKLGADIPFFLYGKNAFVEGIGEKLSAIDTPDCWYLILFPCISIPTIQIFQSKELTRNTEPIKILDFPVHSILDQGKNDLQPVAVNLYTELGAALKWLDRFSPARMTGSGSCVFARFHNEADVDAVLKQLPAHWKAWKAHSMQEHPLSGLMETLQTD